MPLLLRRNQYHPGDIIVAIFADVDYMSHDLYDDELVGFCRVIIGRLEDAVEGVYADEGTQYSLMMNSISQWMVLHVYSESYAGHVYSYYPDYDPVGEYVCEEDVIGIAPGGLKRDDYDALEQYLREIVKRYRLEFQELIADVVSENDLSELEEEWGYECP
jgi:hypothetical protein